MDYSTLVIWVIALAMGIAAYYRREPCYREGLTLARKQTLIIIPRLILAVLAAGFFAQLIPTPWVARWLGKEAGLTGILIASLVGGLTPGGPILCFPLIYVFYKTGASVPALMAFLTAWSVLAFHRVLTYEIPLLGMRFVKIRFLSCLFLPPLAGLLTSLVINILHIDI